MSFFAGVNPAGELTTLPRPPNRLGRGIFTAHPHALDGFGISTSNKPFLHRCAQDLLLAVFTGIRVDHRYSARIILLINATYLLQEVACSYSNSMSIMDTGVKHVNVHVYLVMAWLKVVSWGREPDVTKNRRHSVSGNTGFSIRVRLNRIFEQTFFIAEWFSGTVLHDFFHMLNSSNVTTMVNKLRRLNSPLGLSLDYSVANFM